MPWEEIGLEAHEYIMSRKEAILKEWLTNITGGNYKLTIGYNFNMPAKHLKIYSKHPGMLIGKGGEYIDLLKQILNKKFHGEWTVDMIEVNDGFLTIGKK